MDDITGFLSPGRDRSIRRIRAWASCVVDSQFRSLDMDACARSCEGTLVRHSSCFSVVSPACLALSLPRIHERRHRRMLDNLPQRGREAIPRLARSLLGVRVITVSAGYAHTVAVSADGRAYSSGQNDRGQVRTLNTWNLGCESSPRRAGARAMGKHGSDRRTGGEMNRNRFGFAHPYLVPSHCEIHPMFACCMLQLSKS